VAVRWWAVALRNQLNPDKRQRKNHRHHHWRAVAPPPTRSPRNGLARTVTGVGDDLVVEVMFTDVFEKSGCAGTLLFRTRTTRYLDLTRTGR